MLIYQDQLMSWGQDVFVGLKRISHPSDLSSRGPVPTSIHCVPFYRICWQHPICQRRKRQGDRCSFPVRYPNGLSITATTLAGGPRAGYARGGPAAAVHLVDTTIFWLQSNPLNLFPLRCRRVAHLAFLVVVTWASLILIQRVALQRPREQESSRAAKRLVSGTRLLWFFVHGLLVSRARHECVRNWSLKTSKTSAVSCIFPTMESPLENKSIRQQREVLELHPAGT